jgi:1,2-diacylglycerol 3-beta-glucosyltransferase
MPILFLLYITFLGFVVLTVLYIFVLAVAGHFGRADDIISVKNNLKNQENNTENTTVFRKIGVLIPAYKEDRVIVETVTANLTQNYPADRFDLIVIADSLQTETLAALSKLPIRVVMVSFEASTVAKAINAALAQITDNQYDIITVSDADNLMATDFLARINTAFGQGWRAVQGHRVAKNLNTSVAVLDAISEEINNHLFRKGNRALGLSAAIIGSGMGIEPGLMRAAMQQLVTMGGYDKELEMNLVLAGITVGYLEDALIYDEKIANAAGFEKQRTRWIAAQWQFLTAYFGRGLTDGLRGRWGSFFKVAQALILPRVLLLGLLGVCTVLGVFIGNMVAWALPLATLFTLIISLLLSIPAYLRQRITGRELLQIPVLMLRFVRAVFNIRKAFKSFLPTTHTGE